MAQNQSPAFFAVAILLLAAAAPPLAIAQPPPALPIVGGLPLVGSLLSGIAINGTVCCTPTGSCPGGPPLAGVPVTLVCRIAGVNVNVGQGNTSANGTFAINIGNVFSQLLGTIAAIPGGMLPCNASIQLPLSETVCPVLNLTNAVAMGVPMIVGTLLSQVRGLFGLATVPSFQVVVGTTA